MMRGEAFDKTAKLMGLPYPGGPEIARLAALWHPRRFVFSNRPHEQKRGARDSRTSASAAFEDCDLECLATMRSANGDAGEQTRCDEI